MLENFANYTYYSEFVKEGSISIQTKNITRETWKDHYAGILNIMRDGIETDQVQNGFITVDFGNGDVIDLSITDYYFNLMMWHLIIHTGRIVTGEHLFFDQAITRNSIKKFIDTFFIEQNRKVLNNIVMNNIIDDTLHNYADIDEFALYLADTINLEDDIELMKKNKEYYDLLHGDFSCVPIEDVKNVGMEFTNRAIEIIKHSKEELGHGYSHCLAESFNAHEGINDKQYKEYGINIGSKPDGQGGAHPVAINKSFLTGGVNDILSQYIESNASRLAQIMSKNNVGDSGHFARLLGLNNTDTFLHKDPNYVCNTQNFQTFYVANKDTLKKIIDKYYRMHQNGEEFLVHANDTFLIGKTILLRSPMTCASAAHGGGICYRCYGDLAFTNADINIGKIAAEELSSKFTQILLSAKHLLETIIKKLKWSPEFEDFFEVEGNIIKLLSDLNLKGAEMIIDPETIQLENEDDFKKRDYSIYDEEGVSDNVYNEYITEFEIHTANKDVFTIKTEDEDNKTIDKMFLSNELNEIIRKEGTPIDGKLHIELSALEGASLFFMQIHNNELSRTMDSIKDTINKNEKTKSLNRHQILQEFVKTLIEGHLDVHIVHCEVILMNQLRSVVDILDCPDWEYKDEPCEIITLNQALTDNPRVIISLEYQKLSRLLYNPLTFRKHKPSFMDLLFMVKPQEYLNDTEILPSEKQPDKLINPIIKTRK